MQEATPEPPSNQQVWTWLKAKAPAILIGLGVLAAVLGGLYSCVGPFKEATYHGAHLCGINSTSQRDENDAAQTLHVGVDHVGASEDLLVRPLSPLVASLGPFVGAVVRGDGSLHLALDVESLAPRVRALYSVQ